jgi:uncharacterized membrane protein
MSRLRQKGLNVTVSHVLAGGLVLSVVLLLIGAVLAISGRGPSVPSVTSITDMPRAIAALEPGGFLDLGLLVLLATPVARAIVLAAGFARRRSWLFFGMSTFVLALLALSAYLGLRG